MSFRQNNYGGGSRPAGGGGYTENNQHSGGRPNVTRGGGGGGYASRGGGGGYGSRAVQSNPLLDQIKDKPYEEQMAILNPDWDEWGEMPQIKPINKASIQPLPKALPQNPVQPVVSPTPVVSTPARFSNVSDSMNAFQPVSNTNVPAQFQKVFAFKPPTAAGDASFVTPPQQTPISQQPQSNTAHFGFSSQQSPSPQNVSAQSKVPQKPKRFEDDDLIPESDRNTPMYEPPKSHVSPVSNIGLRKQPEAHVSANAIDLNGSRPVPTTNGSISLNFSSNWLNKTPSVVNKNNQLPPESGNVSAFNNENCSMKVWPSNGDASSVTPTNNPPLVDIQTVQRSVEKVVEWTNKNATLPSGDIDANQNILDDDLKELNASENASGGKRNPQLFSGFSKEDFVQIARISNKFFDFFSELNNFLQDLAQR